MEIVGYIFLLVIFNWEDIILHSQFIKQRRIYSLRSVVDQRDHQFDLVMFQYHLITSREYIPQIHFISVGWRWRLED